MVYGSFKERAAAKVIDQVIVGIMNAAFISIWQEHKEVLGLIPAIQVFFNAGFSAAFLERFAATPGKMLLGLKVLRPDGSRISGARALGRSGAELLSVLVLYFGYLMALQDSEHRTLHDRIAGTRVYKVR